MNDLPYSLLADLESVKGNARPPVHLWQPESVKDIDLVIGRDGTWHYNGSPIKRPRLVRLFSSVMRKEDNDYFLVTPVEKCRIQVEDVPFQIVLMDVEGEGRQQVLTCTTDMAERVVIDDSHPLHVVVTGEEWVPYVLIRDDLVARMVRSVYYQLAELVVEENGQLGVWSTGSFFEMKDAAG